MINWLQVEQFACHISRDLIIFPAHHTHNRKNGGKSIIYQNIIKIQNSEHSVTGSGL